MAKRKEIETASTGGAPEQATRRNGAIAGGRVTVDLAAPLPAPAIEPAAETAIRPIW